MELVGKESSHQVLKSAKQDWDGGNTAAAGASAHHTCLGSSMSHRVPALEREKTSQHSTSGRFPSPCTLIGRHNTRSSVYITGNGTAK